VESQQDALQEATLDGGDFKQLAPRHFEELVAQLLSAAGYEVQSAPLTRDGGFDLIASVITARATERIIVECKAWKNPVGVAAVRKLAELKELNPASRVVLVTTSRFTSSARHAAQAAGVDLADLDALTKWVREGRMPSWRER
jgi:restriction system protein